MGWLNQRTQPVKIEGAVTLTATTISLSAAQLAALIAAIQSGKNIPPSGVLAAAADVHEPASNTAAVVTYTGSAGVAHVISGIGFGYDGDPAGGYIQITNDGAVVFKVPITKSGAGWIYFDPPKKATLAKTMVVTLAAGGAGITGKVSVLGHWTE